MVEEPTTYLCPHCGVPMTISAPGESIVRCPGCDQPVLLENGSQEREAELNGVRVHQLAASRRAAMRVQTYFYVAAVGCVAAAAESVYKAWYAGAWNVTRFLLVALAIFSAWGMIYFFRHARNVARELREPLLNEPTAPPDFSKLSNGSQRLKDLEDLTGHR